MPEARVNEISGELQVDAAGTLRATAVRIVCANIFRAAELEGARTGTTFSFVHKSGWRNRIDGAP